MTEKKKFVKVINNDINTLALSNLGEVYIYIHHLNECFLGITSDQHLFLVKGKVIMRNNLALNEFVVRRKKNSTRNNSSLDRRSGVDRRKSNNRDYFFLGGIERRSWHERRKLWYMTM